MSGYGNRRPQSTNKLRKPQAAAQQRHDVVMTNLVQRYVTTEHRRTGDYGVTHRDVRKIRHDVSSLRYELKTALESKESEIAELRETAIASREENFARFQDLKDCSNTFENRPLQ